MKIRCLILRKDKQIIEKKVNPNTSRFKYQGGLYTLNKEAVNITEYPERGVNPTPELIYVEGNPLPVNVSGNVMTFLDHLVVQNALQQVSNPRSKIFSLVADYVKNPVKLIPLVIVFIILVAFLMGMIKT